MNILLKSTLLKEKTINIINLLCLNNLILAI